jgi:hypothetical protein
VDAADVDDAAVAALAHARQHRPGQAGHADQHDLDQEIPLVDRELFQRRDMLQAGVVDQHVHRAGDRGQRMGDAGIGGHVQHHGLGRAARGPDLRGDRRGTLGRQVADDQVVAGGRQLAGDAGADAAGRAGDEDVAHWGSFSGGSLRL